jgi:hypothetical protein
MTKPQSLPLSDELQSVFDRAAAFADTPQVAEAYREAVPGAKALGRSGKGPGGISSGSGG